MTLIKAALFSCFASFATSCPISYIKMQERYAFSPRIWREEHLTSLSRNYNHTQQNTLLQKFAALAFNLTKLTFISCMKGLFSWNYFICILHIYDALIGLTLSRLGFFCLLGLVVGVGGPAANISKSIKCMPMKLSPVDRMVKLNIPYTFVVKTRNCERIMTPSVRKIPIRNISKKNFPNIFMLFC